MTVTYFRNKPRTLEQNRAQIANIVGCDTRNGTCVTHQPREPRRAGCYDEAMRIILIRPTAGARVYQTCHIHGQRIPTGGDCAVCVEHLYQDLEALERGE